MLQRYDPGLKDADDITLRGYVQMPRVVFYSKHLSDGDKVIPTAVTFESRACEARRISGGSYFTRKHINIV